MILQLDVGNSALKWRLCEAGDVLARGTVPRRSRPALPSLDRVPQAVWVASVAGSDYEAELTQAVEAAWQCSPWFARASALACGVSNSYAEPQRMGVDRWLAMIAARQRLAGPVCVIDAGSALTIDFLDGAGAHVGGYIIPGLAMMEGALLGNTDRVRFEAVTNAGLEPGTDTAGAVSHGILLAQVGAIGMALERYGKDCSTLFSGGNGQRAMQLLGRGGEFCEDLVLDGLACLGEACAPGQRDSA